MSPILGRPIIGLIRLYQHTLGRLMPARCRFHPTCSNYAIAAIRINGPIVGFAQAVWRIMRCGPWHSGGVEHVRPVGSRGRRRAAAAAGGHAEALGG